MRRLLLLKNTVFVLFCLVIPCLSFSQINPPKHIDFSKDTISSTNANNAQRSFANALNGTGKKASSSVNLPVDKLKEIMDACSASGVDMVKVMIISIRAEDVTHYSNHNPGLSTADKADIVGRQMLVFRVPRRAFASSTGFNMKASGNNPLMASLLSAGLMQINYHLSGLPIGSDDLYFSFGGICPPPTSCD